MKFTIQTRLDMEEMREIDVYGALGDWSFCGLSSIAFMVLVCSSKLLIRRVVFIVSNSSVLLNRFRFATSLKRRAT
jgi:hypothetical protein